MTVYRGDAWPAEYRGNVFVGEVANNLVYRARLEPDGVGLIARRADKDVEFLASTDNWFRPVQFANGPDGCLYVIDMYRELIEGADVPAAGHPQAPGRRQRHRSRPHLSHRAGRVQAAEAAAAGQGHDGGTGGAAGTSQRLAPRHGLAPALPAAGPRAVAPLRKLAAGSKSPLGRMHALYALDGLEGTGGGASAGGTRRCRSAVREHAVRLAERFEQTPAVREKLGRMTDDPDVHVRYQLAFSLGAVGGEAPAEGAGEVGDARRGRFLVSAGDPLFVR